MGDSTGWMAEPARVLDVNKVWHFSVCSPLSHVIYYTVAVSGVGQWPVPQLQLHPSDLW